jgi:hypothetical protein
MLQSSAFQVMPVLDVFGSTPFRLLDQSKNFRGTRRTAARIWV